MARNDYFITRLGLLDQIHELGFRLRYGNEHHCTHSENNKNSTESWDSCQERDFWLLKQRQAERLLIQLVAH
jgi:hypothetical protein